MQMSSADKRQQPIEVDWSKFDIDLIPESEVQCECGTMFHTHAKVVFVYDTKDGEAKTITRKPCPNCNRTEGHMNIYGDWEEMKI